MEAVRPFVVESYKGGLCSAVDFFQSDDDDDDNEMELYVNGMNAGWAI